MKVKNKKKIIKKVKNHQTFHPQMTYLLLSMESMGIKQKYRKFNYL
jgi:hypothetical protein